MFHNNGGPKRLRMNSSLSPMTPERENNPPYGLDCASVTENLDEGIPEETPETISTDQNEKEGTVGGGHVADNWNSFENSSNKEQEAKDGEFLPDVSIAVPAVGSEDDIQRNEFDGDNSSYESNDMMEFDYGDYVYVYSKSAEEIHKHADMEESSPGVRSCAESNDMSFLDSGEHNDSLSQCCQETLTESTNLFDFEQNKYSVSRRQEVNPGRGQDPISIYLVQWILALISNIRRVANRKRLTVEPCRTSICLVSSRPATPFDSLWISTRADSSAALDANFGLRQTFNKKWFHILDVLFERRTPVKVTTLSRSEADSFGSFSPRTPGNRKTRRQAFKRDEKALVVYREKSEIGHKGEIEHQNLLNIWQTAAMIAYFAACRAVSKQRSDNASTNQFFSRPSQSEIELISHGTTDLFLNTKPTTETNDITKASRSDIWKRKRVNIVDDDQQTQHDNSFFDEPFDAVDLKRQASNLFCSQKAMDRRDRKTRKLERKRIKKSSRLTSTFDSVDTDLKDHAEAIRYQHGGENMEEERRIREKEAALLERFGLQMKVSSPEERCVDYGHEMSPLPASIDSKNSCWVSCADHSPSDLQMPNHTMVTSSLYEPSISHQSGRYPLERNPGTQDDRHFKESTDTFRRANLDQKIVELKPPPLDCGSSRHSNRNLKCPRDKEEFDECQLETATTAFYGDRKNSSDQLEHDKTDINIGRTIDCVPATHPKSLLSLFDDVNEAREPISFVAKGSCEPSDDWEDEKSYKARGGSVDTPSYKANPLHEEEKNTPIYELKIHRNPSIRLHDLQAPDPANVKRPPKRTSAEDEGRSMISGGILHVQHAETYFKVGTKTTNTAHNMIANPRKDLVTCSHHQIEAMKLSSGSGTDNDSNELKPDKLRAEKGKDRRNPIDVDLFDERKLKRERKRLRKEEKRQKKKMRKERRLNKARHHKTSASYHENEAPVKALVPSETQPVTGHDEPKTPKSPRKEDDRLLGQVTSDRQQYKVAMDRTNRSHEGQYIVSSDQGNTAVSCHRFDGCPLRKEPEVLLLCSEAFIETWGEVVAQLASGSWEAVRGLEAHDIGETPKVPRHRIRFLDTSLVDACGIDIELGGKRAIVVSAVSSWSDKGASPLLKRVVDNASSSRYMLLEVFICVDVPYSEMVANEINRLQNGFTRQRGNPPTKMLLRLTSTASMAYSIGQSAISAWHVYSATYCMTMERVLSDQRSVERIRFLLSVAPALSIGGALKSLELTNFQEEAQDVSRSWFRALLGKSEQARRSLEMIARQNNNDAGELNPNAMIQLSFALHLFLGKKENHN